MDQKRFKRHVCEKLLRSTSDVDSHKLYSLVLSQDLRELKKQLKRYKHRVNELDHNG